MTKIIVTNLILACLFLPAIVVAQASSREFKIRQQYLNFPIAMQQPRQQVYFCLGKDTLMTAVMRLADGEADYWVFKDVSAYRGQTLKLIFSEPVAGLDRIYPSDTFIHLAGGRRANF